MATQPDRGVLGSGGHFDNSEGGMKRVGAGKNLVRYP